MGRGQSDSGENVTEARFEHHCDNCGCSFSRHSWSASSFSVSEHYELSHDTPHDGAETVLDLCYDCYDAVDRKDWETLLERRQGAATPKR